MTILIQRRTTVLRRWTDSELWAITKAGYLHHIHPDPSIHPRPFRTLNMARQGMSVSIPVRLLGGMSMFEISWEIHPVYFKGMKVTDGTWVWTFKGKSEQVELFVATCKSLIVQYQSTGWREVYPRPAVEVPPSTTDGSVVVEAVDVAEDHDIREIGEVLENR
jgi:hypothetical protein